MPLTIDELTQALRDAALSVSSALERAEERDVVIAAHQTVDRVSQQYKEALDGLPEGEKLKLERQLGRRLVDLKRNASLLPRIGTIASSTPDRVAGRSEVGERRITGVSWGAGSRDRDVSGALKVGGDVEAWCGPCGGLTTHSIIAMVGQEPKQVLCQACNGRHGYRTTPARRTGAADGASASAGPGEQREEKKKLDKKAAEQRALAEEVASAAEVRDWNPKERYRTGEVLYHPEFGRGKVETVLRSSLLVRFTHGGLKPLILI